mgnify:FL=1
MEERGGLGKPLNDTWQDLASTRVNNQRTAGGIIRFLGYDSDGRAINSVEIWLKPEELSAFTQSLVAYPVPLPTDYLQTAEPCGDGLSVRIRSHESPKTFVSRLSSALSCLEQPA